MVDVQRRRTVLRNGLGGLSGPAILPIALRMVYQASRAVKHPDLRDRRDRRAARTPSPSCSAAPARSRSARSTYTNPRRRRSRSATGSPPIAARTGWRASASWSGRSRLASGSSPARPESVREIKHLELPATGAFDISPSLFGTGISGEGGRCVRLFLSPESESGPRSFQTRVNLGDFAEHRDVPRHSRRACCGWSSPSCARTGSSSSTPGSAAVRPARWSGSWWTRRSATAGCRSTSARRSRARSATASTSRSVIAGAYTLEVMLARRRPHARPARSTSRAWSAGRSRSRRARRSTGAAASRASSSRSTASVATVRSDGRASSRFRSPRSSAPGVLSLRLAAEAQEVSRGT